MTVLDGVHTDSTLMTSFQTHHTGWSRHLKHGISLMQRWYHKYLSKPWSTQLHKSVIQTKKLQFYLSYWIEPRSSQNPTWRSLVPETIDCYRTRKTDRTRTYPNRTEPSPTHQPIRNVLHQHHSILVLTNYYSSVTNAYDWSILTNQKINLIIFWLVKNGKDKIRTPHWSKK